MSEILSYLNSPHLVANFQKIFGIESHFNDSNSSLSGKSIQNENIKKLKNNLNENVKVFKNDENEIKKIKKSSKKLSDSDSSGTEINVETIGSKVINNDEKLSKTHKKELNGIKTIVNGTDHSHIVANTTIHNRFWYYFFHLGAEMGNELFYMLFFPFWFWNVDSAIGRKVGLLWGVFMYFGQATKDLLCMPRPASPPVVKLEERYRAEYGFPSTHAMVNK